MVTYSRYLYENRFYIYLLNCLILSLFGRLSPVQLAETPHEFQSYTSNPNYSAFVQQ